MSRGDGGHQGSHCSSERKNDFSKIKMTEISLKFSSFKSWTKCSCSELWALLHPCVVFVPECAFKLSGVMQEEMGKSGVIFWP